MKSIIHALVCALALAGSLALAADGDGVKDAFRKTERGFGSLLEGMGQELKKAQKKITKSADEKKDRKAPKN